MVVQERPTANIKQITRDLLQQRHTLARSEKRQLELATQIKMYETKYGIKSRSIHAAIERGHLRETQEVCRWIMDYDLLKRTRAS